MSQNLYDMLMAECCAKTEIAVETQAGKQTSYSQLASRVDGILGALTACGARPGDHVAAQIPKSIDSIALYLAALKGGLVYIPMNTAYTDSELTYFIGDASPRVLVCDPENQDRLNRKFATDRLTVMTLPAHDRAAPGPRVTQHPTTHRGPDDAAAILYTSGTTGEPKGAIITHGSLTWCTRQLVEEWKFTADDVITHTLPMFHAHGLFLAVNLPLAVGGKILLHDRFDAESCIASFARATVFMGVPTLYKRLLASPRLDAQACARMRLFTSGSAPLSQVDFDAFQGRTGQTILERYGMTEALIICSNPLEGDRIAGSVGYALPGVEVRIAKDGAVCPSGMVGMLEVRGPNLFREYLNKPDKTREEMTGDGFLKTGDLARQDADGRVWIAGRQKELIISGGYNVYPKEIENVLDTFDGVGQSAVIGVPHPDYVEGVIAIVVPKSAETRIDLDELSAFARERLAGYKVPKWFLCQDRLPTTSVGKVIKAKLIEQHRTIFSDTENPGR
ncbi:malonyl-CoA/methylmalonyl-CoA synthetase [Lutimaribacter pacificus]|uniref:Malonyl-CoA/methylmalonyl-CoA synthetase n=1 Tax=Lutimaribacter pacificus TaxID=391948 RepID=A0A1H0L9R2_9RHOB|nr:AMP-binding protein [Lutimaribacter pacificus]SDO64947.1 malonyl-CoA/methylmalonyl-CoA synthetase [Lutimaribacter pacificus]SHK69664.1 malonyl-CoA/methylmalonyl-CoA synthetase [Lutimaribacter pacificus]